MDAKELEELQSEDSWDFDSVSTSPPVARKARAVVSVAFPREDYELVERYAAQHQLKVSELIRQATLDAVRGVSGGAAEMRVALTAGGPEKLLTMFEIVGAPVTRGAPLVNEDRPASQAVSG